MPFKINTDKNGLVKVDSTKVTPDDRLLVVFANGDTLQFHTVPSRYIQDEQRTRYYMDAAASNKPQLWVDHSAAPPHNLDIARYRQHGWHGDLGFALLSELRLNTQLSLEVMRIFQFMGENDFQPFEQIDLDPVVLAVFPITVPIGTKELVKYHQSIRV